MNIILATSTNEGYMYRAQTYLDSIEKHNTYGNNVCLCLDFLPEQARKQEPKDVDPWEEVSFNNWIIQYPLVDSSQLRLSLNNFCIQHGEFCDYIPGQPDDVILFTDADLRMQRPFNDAELETLGGLKPGQVFVGYNAGPKDRLEDEAHRLGMKTSLSVLKDAYRDLSTPCFNWGCVAATRETWERICDHYVAMFPFCSEHYLSHVAKQQWLLSWLTSTFFEHVEMPTSFHCHRHYGIPEGCEFKDGLVYSHGQLSLFAHKFDR